MTTVASDISTVAEAAVPSVSVYDRPDSPQPSRTLANPDLWGGPLIFLVKQKRGLDWLEVYVPVRPNGTTGWVRDGEVRLTTHDYRIVVELDAHRLTTWRGDSMLLEEKVAVGTNATPTPQGLFYTRQLIQPLDEGGMLDPDGPYGPYALAISAYSEVLDEFLGGDGEVGIHGTNRPGDLGKDVSHGCIRMSNEAITKLAQTLPLGVPVEVRP
ncbi:MAG: L,D-transpeptidase [Actinomycetota bacterium]|nr:L,D-transpeptidase [Actinomycetota bacterium]